MWDKKTLCVNKLLSFHQKVTYWSPEAHISVTFSAFGLFQGSRGPKYTQNPGLDGL